MKKYLFVVSILILAVLSTLAVSAEEGEELVRTGLRSDAPTHAVRGQHFVGTQELMIEDGHERPLIGTIWYPALNPDGSEEVHAYSHEVWPAPIMGHALFDAALDSTGAPYPLVIFSHGNSAFRQQSLFLTEHLASHGFVVIAIDYEDNFADFGTDAYFSSYTSRPDDVTRQIDYADTLTQTGGALESMIDIESVAVIGHSFGGMTALAAAGAQLDPASYLAWCDQNTPSPGASLPPCQVIPDHIDDMVALAGLDTAPDSLWPGRGDDRVDAIVVLAPAGHVFGAEGTQAITVPAMFLFGSGESNIENNFIAPFEGISSEHKMMIVFENANHYIFINTCQNLPGFIEAGFFGFCSDPVWDQARAHDLINHFTTAFLLVELNGDTESGAVLMPDAVNFPGVTYTTTMSE